MTDPLSALLSEYPEKFSPSGPDIMDFGRGSGSELRYYVESVAVAQWLRMPAAVSTTWLCHLSRYNQSASFLICGRDLCYFFTVSVLFNVTILCYKHLVHNFNSFYTSSFVPFSVHSGDRADHPERPARRVPRTC